jgi:predicted permease
MGNDLRFGLRMLATHPWFSAAIMITLALGIGINTTVFTLVNGVLFKPVALPGGERLAVVNSRHLSQSGGRFGISYPDFVEFQARNRSFEALEALSQGQAVISETGNPPARFRMGRVSWRMFEMVRTPPVLGRGFTAADTWAGAERVAILGHHVWQARYGGADVVGRVVRLNGEPTTITGVMPPGFKFPSGQDLWIPLAPAGELEKRSNRPLTLFGVRRQGISKEQAGADLAVIARRLAGAYPDTNRDTGVSVQTFHEAFNGGPIRTLFLLMLGAVGFVLLIACANVANMMLSRAINRRREVSVRSAMGASRRQLVRQFLTESVLFGAVGGVLGLGLSKIGVHYFDLASLEARPYWITFEMDWLAFAYFAALSVGSGLLFGIVPALRASRVDLAMELKEGTRSAGSVRGGWLAGALVVLQFALTVVLLSGAGVMVRAFLRMQTLNEFVPAGEIFTARISLPGGTGARYAERAGRLRFYEELQRRLSALPGVTHAEVVSILPGNGADEEPIEIEDHPVADFAQAPRASYLAHSPGYPAAIGLPLLAGRAFDERDGETGREAAIATREFASRFWPGEAATGKRFRFIEGSGNSRGPWITVVGVAGDLMQSPQDRDPKPLVLLPYRQKGWPNMALLVRAKGVPPSTLARPVQSVVQAIDPDLPVFDVFTLPEARERQRWMLLVFGSLFFTFAAIGLLIASVGIYAVVAQAAARRTREIGIRMALGSTERGILGLVLVRGVGQIAAGLILGLAGAVAATRLMRGLPGVRPEDPAVFASVTGLLLGVGLLASWLPARRAASLHPVQALREE